MMKQSIRIRQAIALILMFLAASCSVGDVGTGGGGGPTGSADAPILLNVRMTPSEVPHGSSVSFHITFTFTDSDGNLNGGTLTYLREGKINTINLPGGLAGLTGGTPPALFTTDLLSPAVGRVHFQFYLTDNAGNRSNYYSFYLTQI